MSTGVGSGQQTGELSGYRSKCYKSTIRGAREKETKYSMRCYPTVCSDDRNSITLQVGSVKTRCRFPGQVISVPGYDGTITCPRNF